MQSDLLSKKSIKGLLEKALAARDKAYSLSDPPIRVGAALLGKSGKVYIGCNIENDVTNLGVCAERVAVFNAISCGEQEFIAIAIVSDQEMMFPPCGACRQVLWQFISDPKKDLIVVLGRKDGSYASSQILKLSELLPLPFSLKSRDLDTISSP